MDKIVSYTRYYRDKPKIVVNFREPLVTCYTTACATYMINELKSVTEELEQFAMDLSRSQKAVSEGYGSFTCEMTGYVIITKNDQPVNFYADAGCRSFDHQWQWVDPLFVQMSIEFGVVAAIDKTLYCRDASM